jgi:hypothetical protein
LTKNNGTGGEKWKVYDKFFARFVYIQQLKSLTRHQVRIKRTGQEYIKSIISIIHISIL